MKIHASISKPGTGIVEMECLVVGPVNLVMHLQGRTWDKAQ